MSVLNLRLRRPSSSLALLALATVGFVAACGDDSSSSTGTNEADASTKSDGGSEDVNKPPPEKPSGDDAGPGANDDAGPGANDDAGPGANDDAGPGANDDAGPGANDDASAPMGGDAGLDPDAGGFVNNCEGASDETPCGQSGLCFGEVCTPSRCGDGVVDSARGEECEDGNDIGGDGCTLCRFECKEAADCDDANLCNGAETCDAEKHICEPGTRAADGAVCKDSTGSDGECRNQVCAPLNCGNEMVTTGEDCDDGNGDDTDGCTSKCKFTCTADAECDDGNACNGEETCALATHTCVEGTPVTCVSKACDGACEPKTGACVYADLDKDGAGCNVDCVDADPAVFPGGFECKDGKDNDCNAATADADAPGCACYVDADKDGYAASLVGSVDTAGACLDGYTRTLPSNSSNTDCASNVAIAYPGQAAYFPTKYCKPGKVRCLAGGNSFDYNCDGQETSAPADARVAAATCAGGNVLNCSRRSGWVSKVPACGETGTYRSCRYLGGGCSGTDAANRVQACH